MANLESYGDFETKNWLSSPRSKKDRMRPSFSSCERLFFDTDDDDRTRGKKRALRVGFEPTREDPIGFLVQRLNHSAIAALLTGVRMEDEFLSSSHDFHRRTLPYNQTARIIEHGDVIQVHIEPIVSTHRRKKIDFIAI